MCELKRLVASLAGRDTLVPAQRSCWKMMPLKLKGRRQWKSTSGGRLSGCHQRSPGTSTATLFAISLSPHFAANFAFIWGGRQENGRDWDKRAKPLCTADCPPPRRTTNYCWSMLIPAVSSPMVVFSKDKEGRRWASKAKVDVSEANGYTGEIWPVTVQRSDKVHLPHRLHQGCTCHCVIVLHVYTGECAFFVLRERAHDTTWSLLCKSFAYQNNRKGHTEKSLTCWKNIQQQSTFELYNNKQP